MQSTAGRGPSTSDTRGAFAVVGRAPADMLDEVPWGYHAGPFDALGHRFSVRTTDPALGRFVDAAFASLATSGVAAHTYSHVNRLADDRHALYADDELVVHTRRPDWALSHLMWRVNNQAVSGSSGGLVLLHAAGAVRGGVAVVLPGAASVGKTTLVAGLLRNGFGYLTDEAVAIDPASGVVVPYPKPLSVDRGSWSVLAAFAPCVDAEVAPYLREQWLVAPPVDSCSAISVRPRIVIAPQYVRGATTALVPVARAEMLLLLAQQTFGFARAVRRNFATLAEILADCHCYRLVVGDLDSACRAVADVVAAHAD